MSDQLKTALKEYLTREKRRALERGWGELPYLSHTFGGLLLSKGESPVYVKKQLGHHSIQITVDIYGRWVQTKNRAGVQKLDTQPTIQRSE
jgi:integrase